MGNYRDSQFRVHGFLATPACLPQPVVTLEDAPAGALDGRLGGIEWGQGQWAIDDAPCGSCQPHLAYFRDGTSSLMCRDFTFVTPSVLQSFTSSAHIQAGHVTLRSFDAAGHVVDTFSAVVTHDTCTPFQTRWAQRATSVEVCFEFGWELAFDNVTYCTP